MAIVPRAAGVQDSPLADLTANGIGVPGRDETSYFSASDRVILYKQTKSSQAL